MSNKLKLGYKASAEQFAPRPLVEFAVLAEETGFESVWVSDHFQPWRHTDGHAPFSLAWMAAVGERTQKVTIGTSVATPTFRYHPSVVAQAFATLDCLYPGRHSINPPLSLLGCSCAVLGRREGYTWGNFGCKLTHGYRVLFTTAECAKDY